jgi:hypothetical protein
LTVPYSSPSICAEKEKEEKIAEKHNKTSSGDAAASNKTVIIKCPLAKAARMGSLHGWKRTHSSIGNNSTGLEQHKGQ